MDIMSQSDIFNKDYIKLSEQDKDKIIKIAKCVKKSIDFYGGFDTNTYLLTYKNDLIIIDPIEVICFALSLIRSNRFDDFINNPDIMLYTKYEHTNKSCLILYPTDPDGYKISQEFESLVSQIIESLPFKLILSIQINFGIRIIQIKK